MAVLMVTKEDRVRRRVQNVGWWGRWWLSWHGLRVGDVRQVLDELDASRMHFDELTNRVANNVLANGSKVEELEAKVNSLSEVLEAMKLAALNAQEAAADRLHALQETEKKLVATEEHALAVARTADRLEKERDGLRQGNGALEESIRAHQRELVQVRTHRDDAVNLATARALDMERLAAEVEQARAQLAKAEADREALAKDYADLAADHDRIIEAGQLGATSREAEATALKAELHNVIEVARARNTVLEEEIAELKDQLEASKLLFIEAGEKARARIALLGEELAGINAQREAEVKAEIAELKRENDRLAAEVVVRERDAIGSAVKYHRELEAEIAELKVKLNDALQRADVLAANLGLANQELAQRRAETTGSGLLPVDALLAAKAREETERLTPEEVIAARAKAEEALRARREAAVSDGLDPHEAVNRLVAHVKMTAPETLAVELPVVVAGEKEKGFLSEVVERLTAPAEPKPPSEPLLPSFADDRAILPPAQDGSTLVRTGDTTVAEAGPAAVQRVEELWGAVQEVRDIPVGLVDEDEDDDDTFGGGA